MCCRCVAGVFQVCCRCVAGVLQVCCIVMWSTSCWNRCRGMWLSRERLLQVCCRCVAGALQMCCVLQVCCRCVAVCYRCVAGVLQECCSVTCITSRWNWCCGMWLRATVAATVAGVLQVRCRCVVYTLHHTAPQYTTLQHFQHAATHCNTLQHTATYCTTPSRNPAPLQHTLQHTCSQSYAMQKGICLIWFASDTTRCNTLQHTATHCNTPAHNPAPCSKPSASFDFWATSYSSFPPLVIRCVAVCCSVLQCVTVYCGVSQRVAVCCSEIHKQIIVYQMSHCMVTTQKNDLIFP